MNNAGYQSSGFSTPVQHSQHHQNSATPTVSNSPVGGMSDANMNSSPNGGSASSPSSQNCHYSTNGNNSPATSGPGFLNQHLVPPAFGAVTPGIVMTGVRPAVGSVMGFGQNIVLDSQNIASDMMLGLHMNKGEPLPLVDPAIAFHKTLKSDAQFSSYFQNLQNTNNNEAVRSTNIEQKMFQIFKQQMGYDVTSDEQKTSLSTDNSQLGRNNTSGNALPTTLSSGNHGLQNSSNQLNTEIGSFSDDADHHGSKKPLSGDSANTWGSSLPSMAMMAGISSNSDEVLQEKKKKKKGDKPSPMNKEDISGFPDGNINGLGLVAAAAAAAQRTTENNALSQINSSSNDICVQPIFPNTYQGFHDTMVTGSNIKSSQISDGPVSCDICGILCANSFGLSLHKKSHVQTFKCKQCSFVGGTSTQLHLHEKYTHLGVDVPVTDTTLGQGFSGSSNALNNINNLEAEQQKSPTTSSDNGKIADYPFKCTVCKGAFRRKQDLTRHLQVHKTPHKCSVCEEDFPNKQKLATHTAEHHRSGIFTCFQCLAQFTHPIHLQLHLNICNQNTTAAIQKRWKNVEQTNSTTTSHLEDSEKRNVCNVCGKGFKMIHYLKSHMRTHTGERPFSCNVCFKSFSQRSTLKVHNRIHTGEKPYQCTMCKKSFSVRLYLQAHIRTHTGERPYQCNICNRSFSQRSSLVTHTKRHDGY